MQNVGATYDSDGLLVPVTEDIRNGNGRALKSKFWTPHRAYKFDNKVDSIFWIMKDDSLPPIIKVNSSVLASTLGATLATKRSSAEHGAIVDKLVIEPYANPFRLYPLRNDYNKFKDLFENTGIDCYVINTGYFLKNDITPKITLGLIENIVEKKIKFHNINNIEDISFTDIDGYNPDFNDKKYKELFISRLEARVEFIDNLFNQDILPLEARESILKVIEELKK